MQGAYLSRYAGHVPSLRLRPLSIMPAEGGSEGVRSPADWPTFSWAWPSRYRDGIGRIFGVPCPYIGAPNPQAVAESADLIIISESRS
jgi:hypothetical protein